VLAAVRPCWTTVRLSGGDGLGHQHDAALGLVQARSRARLDRGVLDAGNGGVGGAQGLGDLRARLGACLRHLARLNRGYVAPGQDLWIVSEWMWLLTCTGQGGEQAGEQENGLRVHYCESRGFS
jgi:hypothetical protein